MLRVSVSPPAESAAPSAIASSSPSQPLSDGSVAASPAPLAAGASGAGAGDVASAPVVRGWEPPHATNSEQAKENEKAKGGNEDPERDVGMAVA
jgi:hypothetical protein